MRDFSNLYRRPDGGEDRSRPEESFWTPPGATTQFGDALAQGVQLAYQVIERYIAEGRRAAEQLAQQPYNTRAVAGNFQQLAEVMLRYSTEMMPIWIEMLRALVTSASSLTPVMQTPVMPGSSGPIMQGPSQEASHRGSLPVSIEVASKLPIRVHVDLPANVDPRSLAILGLRALDATKPELTAVTLLPPSNGGPPTLRLQIPDGQPSGIYLGVVADSNTGESRGTISVTVEGAG